jgi:hypothetical protein
MYQVYHSLCATVPSRVVQRSINNHGANGCTSLKSVQTMKWNAFTLSIISVLWTCKLLHFIPEHVWAKQRSDCVKLFGFPILWWRFLHSRRVSYSTSKHITTSMFSHPKRFGFPRCVAITGDSTSRRHSSSQPARFSHPATRIQ